MSQNVWDTSLPRTKKFCSPKRWEVVARAEAEKAGVDLIKMLAGHKRRVFVEARWNAFRVLAGDGFSYLSIGQASGFDHSTVQHGCKEDMRVRRYERHRAYLERKAGKRA